MTRMSISVTVWLVGLLWRVDDDQDGLTTTEIAVVTFLLVGAAIVVMGIIYAAATSNANNIPVPQAPAP